VNRGAFAALMGETCGADSQSQPISIAFDGQLQLRHLELVLRGRNTNVGRTS